MKSFRSKPVGWRNESYRHSLAARGYSSSKKIAKIGHHLWSEDKEDTVELREEMGLLIRDLRTRRADWWNDPVLSKRWSDFMVEKVWSPERREIVRETVEAQWNAPGFKEEMGDVSRKRWADEEYKEFVSKRMREVVTPERREAQRKRFENDFLSDPEFIKKRDEALRIARADDEKMALMRKKLSEAAFADSEGRSKRLKERWRDEDYQKEHSEIMKKLRKDSAFQEIMEKAAVIGREERSQKITDVREAIAEVEGDNVAKKFNVVAVKV